MLRSPGWQPRVTDSQRTRYGYWAASAETRATRTGVEFDQLRADRNIGYGWLPPNDADWRRALDVQSTLGHTGRARAVGLPDLLIAAVAEREQLTLIHYDSDFDIITNVTGQTAQWVVPRGSVLYQVRPTATRVVDEIEHRLKISESSQPIAKWRGAHRPCS